MNIKKLHGKFLQLPNVIQTTLSIAAIVFVSIALSVPIIVTLMFFDRSHCLDSPHPRRYNGKCEEYHNGEWGEPRTPESGIYYYNGAGNRITK